MLRKHHAVIALLALPALGHAKLDTITVVNGSNTLLYIHQGGYAPSQQLKAGQSLRLTYPFSVIPPNETKPLHTSILIATVGGRWLTTPNGFTYLHQPTLCLKTNYVDNKQPNATWTIKKNTTSSKDCLVTGYRQPWWQPENG